VCFVWLSEQTAIISLYSIKWLVFVTETECVYCAVRTVSLIHVNNILQNLIILSLFVNIHMGKAKIIDPKRNH